VLDLLEDLFDTMVRPARTELQRVRGNVSAADDGFAVIQAVLSSDETDALARNLASQALQRSRAGARHILAVPAVAALARDPRLIELAANVLGCEPLPFGATLFDKSPDANWLVAWHQDTALPFVERREVAGWGPWSRKAGVDYAHAPAAALSKIVALRVHLDDSTSHNGPLRVLPGTHTLGVLSDEQIRATARRIDGVACTLERGGVVVMRPLLIHASSKATSESSRRVLHLQYAAGASFDGLQLRAA
jgi:ectoine hydroxylase-related dioxygenase (phytanoyl-CoA dioxygenase family)